MNSHHPTYGFFTIVALVIFILTANHITAQKFEIGAIPSNSEQSEIAPAYWGDSIIMASTRPHQWGVKWLDNKSEQPYRIYVTTEFGEKPIPIELDITTPYHIGPSSIHPDGTKLAVTLTLKGNAELKDQMGIFLFDFIQGRWRNPVFFPFNTRTGNFSTCQPAWNRDGSGLFFSSNDPNGKGGYDLYFSELSAGQWQKPISLDQINTASNDLYPFPCGEHFYFTSKSITGEDLDIFMANSENNSIQKANPLDSVINSKSDDFGYVCRANEESGYFCSNRNGNDDIFAFKYAFPTFEGCPPLEKPSFCYLFEELNVLPTDSSHFLYEWELGDGSTSKGLSVEHCYKDYGNYHVALNVYDSLTKARFARISELDVDILRSPFPWIESKDSIQVGEQIVFGPEGTDIDAFEIEEYYWDFGDGRHFQGMHPNYIYKREGEYMVQVGLIGKNLSTGETEKRCAVKKISVGLKETTAPPDTIPSSLMEDMYFVSSEDAGTLSYRADSTVYFVEFKVSELQIPLDDPYFDDIKYEITERFEEKDTLYKYSVGQTTDFNELRKIQMDLKASGYEESMVRETKEEVFKMKTTKKWWYIPDSLTSALNKHINKFSDIQFGYDDFNIQKTSIPNLDYISQVMLQEESFQLSITAHTDSIGSSEHNLKLSQARAEAVIEYFIGKGISRERLAGIGKGETEPIASNSTEEGRALNRRVSFLIILKEDKKDK